VWSHQTTLPIAEVKNATVDQIAYTGFESDADTDKGNWSYVGSSVPGPGKTGQRYYPLAVSTPLTRGLTTAGTYLVSYWAKGSTVQVSGGTVSDATAPSAADADGWVFYQKRVVAAAGTTVKLEVTTGSASLDDVRLHPADAYMITYTYHPLVGVTSQTGPDGVMIYYFYDSLQRLSYIKDQDGNVIKRYQYHYMAAPAPPQTDRTPRWEDVTGSSVCLTAPYGNTGQQQVTQQDNNPDSETFGTTRQITTSNPGACPPSQSAYWVDLDPQQYPYVCEVSPVYGNTGYQLKSQRDNNPNSPTYDQIRQVRGPFDAAGNICKPCGTANNEKWIPPQPGGTGGFCETSYEKVTVENCRYDGAQGGYVTGFAYKFSDNTLSATFYVVNATGCVEF
jgi:hypothetical protein